MALRGDPVFRSLASVIGSSHETQLPLSYVERRPVEEMFGRALAARTHIAVFGTPGVGKSALVRHNVDWANVFFVECLDGQRAPDVYRSMLSEAGARIKTETKLSNKRRLSGTLKVFSGELERDSENTETEITVDLGNVGDVFRILRSRSRRGTFVVLNNFHVLARSVQRRMVGNLQYISEHTDTRFIIVGNWASPASVTLRSLVDDSAGGVAEYYALRESAKKLIRFQAKYGFHPPLLAYDPHGGALIALEPKFRAFLRNESVSLEPLQRDHMRPVNWRLKSGGAWWLKDKWHDPIAEAAAIRRSQAQAAVPVPRARP